MKVFASAIALLFTSAAAASEIHEILTLSSVAEAVSVYHEAQDDGDVNVPCAAEAMELFECLGDKFNGCFMELIKDLEEDTTCDDLKSSDFCPELAKCAAHVDADCDAKGEALKSCAATAYPDQEECDLCTVEEEVIAVEVTSPTAAMSLPHVVKAVSVYHEAKDDADVEIPCVDETIALFTCLGEEFTMCLFEIIKDLEEDTTCDALEASDFCSEITKCAADVAEDADCDAKGEALELCAATAYPDHEQCDDICETDVAILSIA